jgi:hypothetical protein
MKSFTFGLAVVLSLFGHSLGAAVVSIGNFIYIPLARLDLSG